MCRHPGSHSVSDLGCCYLTLVKFQWCHFLKSHRKLPLGSLVHATKTSRMKSWNDDVSPHHHHHYTFQGILNDLPSIVTDHERVSSRQGNWMYIPFLIQMWKLLRTLMLEPRHLRFNKSLGNSNAHYKNQLPGLPRYSNPQKLFFFFFTNTQIS